MTDPRLELLSPRKREGLEQIDRARNAILAGDPDFPAIWHRIINICRLVTAGADYREKYHFWLGGERDV